MRFIVRHRSQGKTTKLIEWMKAAPEGEARVLITHSLGETNRLQRENPDMASWQFVNIPDLTGAGFMAGVLAGRRNVVLAIDNLDMVLQSLLRSPFPIEVVAATGELDD